MLRTSFPMAITQGPRCPLRFDPFELDTRSGELRKDGLRIKVQEKPLRVLELLLERPGELVTREELRQRLWSSDTFVDFDAGLNTAVNKLRMALGDSAEEPRFVETLGRRGYRFIGSVEQEAARLAPRTESVGPSPPAEVTPQAEAAPAPTEFEPAAAKAAPATRPRRHRLPLLTFMAAGLLLAAGWIGWRFANLAKPAIQSIAVLPLTNLSGEPEQEYFADGMTEALITDLASLNALRVISRQSVMAYKGSRKPLPEIGRELNVEAVIEGSVLRSGGRVRVTAQLVHAASDRHLWARSYEHGEGDLIALQGELARAITQEVRARVTPAVQHRLSARSSARPEAYDAYLRGRYFWNRLDEEGLNKAVTYFEQAVAADPGYALAYAGLAETWGPLGYRGYVPPSEARERMRAAAVKAVELGPELAEAHNGLAACLAFHEWNWAEAEKEFRRAIDLDPHYGLARAWYGLYLTAMGRHEAALRERLTALDSDPLSLATNQNVATSLAALGRIDAAIEQYRKTLELEPRFHSARVGLADMYALKGLREQALAEMRRADADSGGHAFTRASLAHLLAPSGDRAGARRLLAELIGRSRERYVSPFLIAVLHADLGEPDRAFEWLERAYEQRVPELSQLKTYGPLQALRSDPRYQDLLRRMKLL